MPGRRRIDYTPYEIADSLGKLLAEGQLCEVAVEGRRWCCIVSVCAELPVTSAVGIPGWVTGGALAAQPL